MAEQQPRFNVYEDSGKIVKINLNTKESHSVWPRELEQHIARGTVPDFWNDEQVLAVLKKMLPRVSTSQVFADRISETKNQIAILEAELVKIPTRKAAVLAQEMIDQAALDALEAEEERDTKAVANLKTRVSLLLERQEAAEAEEAAQRLRAILAEGERIVELEAPALAAYETESKVLAERAQAIADLHKQRHELASEATFLCERFKLSHLAIPQLRELPNGLVTGNELVRVFGSSRQGSVWEKRRNEWQNSRRRPQAVSAEQ
jgi:hypothetical protein